MSTDVYIVVPFSRPENEDHVGEMIAHQLPWLGLANVKTIAVCNGMAALATPFWADLCLRPEGEASPGGARNAAIEHLRATDPEAFVAFMDDDDIYTPYHLGEVLEAARHGAVIGRPTGWTLFDDTRGGLVHFTQSPNSFIGGTIGGYVSEMPTFLHIPCGEDGAFVRAARERGLDCVMLAPRNHVYVRKPGRHAYRAREEKMWLHMGDVAYVDDGECDMLSVACDVPSGPLVSYSQWRKNRGES